MNVWLRVTRECWWKFGGAVLHYQPGDWLYASPEGAERAMRDGCVERLFPERAA